PVLAGRAVDVGAAVIDAQGDEADVLDDGRPLVVAVRWQRDAGKLGCSGKSGQEDARDQQREGSDRLSGHKRSFHKRKSWSELSYADTPERFSVRSSPRDPPGGRP